MTTDVVVVWVLIVTLEVGLVVEVEVVVRLEVEVVALEDVDVTVEVVVVDDTGGPVWIARTFPEATFAT